MRAERTRLDDDGHRGSGSGPAGTSRRPRAPPQSDGRRGPGSARAPPTAGSRGAPSPSAPRTCRRPCRRIRARRECPAACARSGGGPRCLARSRLALSPSTVPATAGVAPPPASASAVAGSTAVCGGSPFACWNSLSAAAVPEPNSPSGVSPKPISFRCCWSSVTRGRRSIVSKVIPSPRLSPVRSAASAGSGALPVPLSVEDVSSKVEPPPPAASSTPGIGYAELLSGRRRAAALRAGLLVRVQRRDRAAGRAGGLPGQRIDRRRHLAAVERGALAGEAPRDLGREALDADVERVGEALHQRVRDPRVAADERDLRAFREPVGGRLAARDVLPHRVRCDVGRGLVEEHIRIRRRLDLPAERQHAAREARRVADDLQVADAAGALPLDVLEQVVEGREPWSAGGRGLEVLRGGEPLALLRRRELLA